LTTFAIPVLVVFPSRPFSCSLRRRFLPIFLYPSTRVDGSVLREAFAERRSTVSRFVQSVCLFHTRKERRVSLGRYSRLRPGMHISGARRYHALLATPAWNNLALIALLHVRPAYHVKNNAARKCREAFRHARATCFSRLCMSCLCRLSICHCCCCCCCVSALPKN